ncbi:MAG: hypothetical protein WBG46_06255 [Nonlabens sp.]
MNDLLDKYWEGTLELQEENKLRSYFKSDKVAPEHEMYRDLFEAFVPEKDRESLDFDAFAKVSDFKPKEKVEPQTSMWKGLAIAAGFSLLIAVGAGYFQNSQQDLGTYDDPEKALAATMEALELVSEKFNNGRENLVPAAQVNEKTQNVFKLHNNPK